MKVLRTVTEKGQVTIPEAIRSELGIESGDRVAFIYDGEGRVTVRKDKASHQRTAGLLDKHLKKGTKGVSIAAMHRAIENGATRGFRP